MELLDLLIDIDKKEYKCYSELLKLLSQNQEFKNAIVQGVKEGKIRRFDEELWEKIRHTKYKGE